MPLQGKTCSRRVAPLGWRRALGPRKPISSNTFLVMSFGDELDRALGKKNLWTMRKSEHVAGNQCWMIEANKTEMRGFIEIPGADAPIGVSPRSCSHSTHKRPPFKPPCSLHRIASQDSSNMPRSLDGRQLQCHQISICEPCVPKCTDSLVAKISKNQPNQDAMRISLSRWSTKACKAILAHAVCSLKSHSIPPPTLAQPPPIHPFAIAGVHLTIIAQCAREIVSAVSDHASGSSDPSASLFHYAALVEAETLPQARRWYRRDLAPALEAVWRAVLRAMQPALTRPAGCTRMALTAC